MAATRSWRLVCLVRSIKFLYCNALDPLARSLRSVASWLWLQQLLFKLVPIGLLALFGSSQLLLMNIVFVIDHGEELRVVTLRICSILTLSLICERSILVRRLRPILSMTTQWQNQRGISLDNALDVVNVLLSVVYHARCHLLIVLNLLLWVTDSLSLNLDPLFNLVSSVLVSSWWDLIWIVKLINLGLGLLLATINGLLSHV